MTECERIIANGTFSEDFLQEEIRNDFFVDKKRKMIWLVCLDLLMELDRVCKKHNLRYWAICGTLLGAVRHGGFIPWDDDIDIAVPREDYEKLIRIAEKEFSYPYFLQTPDSDKGYMYSFIKLRNTNTTGMKTFLRDAPFNLGMSIDIFPMDNCNMVGYEKRYERIKELCIDLSNYMRRYLKNPSDDEKHRIESYSGENPEQILKEIHKLSTQSNSEQCNYIGLNSITIYPCGKLVYRKEDFEKTEYVDFEGGGI